MRFFTSNAERPYSQAMHSLFCGYNCRSPGYEFRWYRRAICPGVGGDHVEAFAEAPRSLHAERVVIASALVVHILDPPHIPKGIRDATEVAAPVPRYPYGVG